MGYRVELMFLHCSACYSQISSSTPGLQMDSDAFAPQIVDSEHAADDIAPKIIEDQDLPNRLAFLVQQGFDLVLSSRRVFAPTVYDGGVMVEAQESFD